MKTRTIIISLIIVAVLVAAALMLINNRRHSPGGTTTISPEIAAATMTATEFTNWEEFFASDAFNTNDRRKLIFIGVDGADWAIVNPMIERGMLPNFKKMKDGGCFGVLRSTTCFYSPPAWVAMMTGYRPKSSGIYTFGNWDAERKKFFPVRSVDVMVPSVWDIASLAGKRSALINVPVTYPVHEVNGLMISGMMTPSTLREYVSYILEFRRLRGTDSQPRGIKTASPIWRADVLFHGNHFEFYMYDSTDDDNDTYDMARVTLKPAQIDDDIMGQAQTYDVPINSFSPWIKLMVKDEATGKFNKGWSKVKVLHSPDSKYPYLARFSHFLFAVGDTDVDFVYPDTLADVLKKELRYYFPSRFLDRDIVPAHTGESADAGLFLYEHDEWDLFMFVFTQTDNIQHLEGDSEFTQRVYREIDRFIGEMIERLPKNAAIVLASDHGFKEYTYSIDLNRYFAKTNLLEYKADNTIDFDRTLVFNNMWNLYFNHELLSKEELRRRGIEVPGDLSVEEALEKHVIELGINFTIEDGTKIPLEFIPMKPLPADDAPDMVTPGDYGDYVIEFWNFHHPSGSITRKLNPTEQWKHRKKGIYIAYGDGIKAGGNTADSDIFDLAPTMLYLLGLPVSPDMDGRVMSHILDADMIAGAELYSVAEYAEFYDNTRISDAEMESMEKKLKSLGYIH
jgi:predicted AlkP superfamily phosphohydrolase/phosphomutase